MAGVFPLPTRLTARQNSQRTGHVPWAILEQPDRLRGSTSLPRRIEDACASLYHGGKSVLPAWSRAFHQQALRPDRQQRQHTAERLVAPPNNHREGYTMSIWLLIFCSILGASLWLWRKRTRRLPQAAGSGAGRTSTPSPYRCVAIRPAEGGACAGARSVEGKRFLARAAPPLPLDTCDSSACRCRYAHFEDRRHAERRRYNPVLRGFGAAAGDVDLRNGVDRRRRSAAGAIPG